MLARGFFQPNYSFGDLPINSITQNKSSVEFLNGNISNGVWRYWVDQWYPVHYRGVGSPFGTYITVSKEFFTRFKEHTGDNYYLIPELTCLDRREYLRYEESIKTFAMLSI